MVAGMQFPSRAFARGFKFGRRFIVASSFDRQESTMPKRHSRGPLPVPVEFIEQKIYLIRGNKVMQDTDLAQLYDVDTFNLNKAVKRNIDRFPADFHVSTHQEGG